MSNSNVSKPESGSKIKSIFLFLATFSVSALVLFQVFTMLISTLDVSNFYLEPDGMVLLLTILSSLIICVIGAVILESVRNSRRKAVSKSIYDKNESSDQSKSVA